MNRRRRCPGTWDIQVLDQRETWADAAGTVHRIRDLTDDHLANIRILLQHRATEIMLDYAIAAELGTITPTAPLPPLTTSVQDGALAWLTQTPLWGALEDEMRRRGATARTGPRPELASLTPYRTPGFTATAGEIRILWAALRVLLTRHHATGALIVPSRLRDPDAGPGDADLLVERVPPDGLLALQRDIDAVVGRHLHATTLHDYPGLTRADLASHAVAFGPGW